MSSMNLLLTALVVLLTGSIAPLCAGRAGRTGHWLGAAGSLLGGGLCLTAPLPVLLSGQPENAGFFWDSGDLFLTLRLDGLAAFFLLPAGLLVLLGGLYGGSYLDRTGKSHLPARPWFYFNVLALSMALVITAADSLTFMIAWEMMSLSSFFLVIHDLQEEQAREAGWFYLVATHLGTAFLFFFFFEEYRLAGTLDFASFTILRELSGTTPLIFFALALIGFGTKAGLFPLHSWLPKAHAAAPSHVSALMSGVMVKVAIYGFLRMLTFLPPLPSWAGLLVASLGITGALFGIAMAATQVDIKRTLAYSTVENIGIIFFGLGLWLYCGSCGFEVAATFALAGSLLHIWNHALFKSLLFMGAGAVVHAAGSREMSTLGGVLRRMPVTGTLLLIGAAAIAALPPLNGLIGELLIYLGLFHAGRDAVGGQAFLFMLFAVLLAMVGGLVLLAMTRMIGIVLGGEPRSPEADRMHESAPAMRVAMGAAAALCLALGIFPQAGLRLLEAPLTVLAPDQPTLATAAAAMLPFGQAWTLAGLLLAGLLVLVIGWRHLSRSKENMPGTWGCGYNRPSPTMAYTAGSYGQLAQDTLYTSFLRPLATSAISSALFVSIQRFRPQLIDPVLDRWFAPLFRQAGNLASSCRRLQAGRMNIYLTYIFLATLLLLGWNYFLS
ncbi:MAG: oxidoreductase [Proteobacteria bacterium]|nr:oxidoreductase [Pseudomonadota bacterium]